MGITLNTAQETLKRISRRSSLRALKDYKKGNLKKKRENKDNYRKLRNTLILNHRRVRGRLLPFYEDMDRYGESHELGILHSKKKVRGVRRMLICGRILLGLAMLGLMLCIGLSIWTTFAIARVH